MTEDYARPLDLGEIVDLTARLYRGNFLFFAGIYAVYEALILAVNLSALGLEAFLKAHSSVPTYVRWAGTAWIAIEALILILLAGAMVAAICRATAWACADRKATIREAYASILPRLGRYVGLTAVLGLVIWGPIMLLLGGYLGVLVSMVMRLKAHGGGAILHTPHPEIALMVIGMSLAFVALLCVGFVYATLMSLRYALAFPACVLEGVKVRQAMRRSAALSKRAWGRIFLFCLLVIVVKVLITVPTQFFLFVAIFTRTPLGFGLRAFSDVLFFITGSFLGPITFIGLTLFFYDQRLRWDGPAISRTPSRPPGPQGEVGSEFAADTTAG